MNLLGMRECCAIFLKNKKQHIAVFLTQVGRDIGAGTLLKL